MLYKLKVWFRRFYHYHMGASYVRWLRRGESSKGYGYDGILKAEILPFIIIDIGGVHLQSVDEDEAKWPEVAYDFDRKASED